jgi:outer membrane lipoprotein SlyB
MKHLYASVPLLSLLLAGCVSSTGYSAPTRLEAARVVDVQHTTSSGSWGTGAAVGGGIGVLTGLGHSTESKVIRGAGGALIGAVVQKALTTGNQQVSIIVRTERGQTLQVAHGYNDLIPGDCVMVESRQDGNVKLARAGSSQCNF